jgi:dTDP-4-dehydrorhamnose 3,5-epimerase
VKTFELGIKGCWVFQPNVHSDARGAFYEWFQDSTFGFQTGSKFEIGQANVSNSNKGVVRGIHFANYPPGQAKYVTCVSGSVLDVVVDLRRDSGTFGKWDSVILDANEPKAVFIPSGIGHAFMALEDNSIFVYLCDQRYNPKNEYEINPMDSTININWPNGITPVLSEKDKAAPSLAEVFEILSINSENA